MDGVAVAVEAIHSISSKKKKPCSSNWICLKPMTDLDGPSFVIYFWPSGSIKSGFHGL